jgi:hypothetical protein
MSKSASDHDWDLLSAIDPLRDAHGASLLEHDQREDLFSRIIETDREAPQATGLAAASRLWLRSYCSPSRTTRPRRLWAAIGASGSAVIGGIIATLVVLSSGASIAYAGWSSTPSAPTAAAVAYAMAQCNRVRFPPPGSNDTTGSDSPVFLGQPVLTEARGVYTALVAVTNGQAYGCLVGPDHAKPFTQFSTESFGPVQSSPDPDQIGVPYTEHAHTSRSDVQLPPAVTNVAGNATVQHMTGAGYGDSVLGQAGADVQSVSFTFDDGNTVTASVENGWYFAWWPWTSTATTVTVTTSNGTTSSPVTSHWMLSTVAVLPGCQPGSSGCVFSQTTTPSTTTPATTQANSSPSTTTTAAAATTTAP